MRKFYKLMGRVASDRTVADILTDPNRKALIYMIENETDWSDWEQGNHPLNHDKKVMAYSKGGGILESYINDPANNIHYAISEKTTCLRTGFLKLRRRPIKVINIERRFGECPFHWDDVDKFINMYAFKGIVDDLLEEINTKIKNT